MAMLKANRLDKEKIERGKLAMGKREADLAERDGVVAELGRKFGEPKESGEEDTMAQAAAGEKDERIEELEKLVLDLEETFLETQFPVRFDGAEAKPTNSYPGSHQGDSVARPTRPITSHHPQCSDRLHRLPTNTRQDRDKGKEVFNFLASEQAIGEAFTGRTSICYAKMVGSTGSAEMFELWQSLFTKILNWGDLPDEYEVVVDWLDYYMAKCFLPQCRRGLATNERTSNEVPAQPI
ncbi:hypothetical protein FRC00_001758 [Tulasnella sp. 408]|nr:hypothetical protein FRC00_001758 [Tulasnella sp. 408]